MSIKSIGFLINSLNNSQNSYTLVNGLNDLVLNQYMISPIVFYQSLNAPIIPSQCCQLHQYHAWGFEGILVSTNILTTKILQQCLKPRKKLFYVYDLEWYYLNNFRFSELQDIYRNPEIDLIARSESHFDILARCWKKPVGIIHNYNYIELISIIEKIGV